MADNREKLFKVLKVSKVVAIICTVFCAVFMLTALVVFVPMLFIKENMIVEAGGLLGFFIDVIKEGENQVQARDLVFAVLPRLSALVLLFVFFLRSALFLKKAQKQEKVSSALAKKSLRSLSVISFLLALIPSVLTSAAKNIVSSVFFNVTETDRTGWLILGFALLIFSLTAFNETSNNNASEETMYDSNSL